MSLLEVSRQSISSNWHHFAVMFEEVFLCLEICYFTIFTQQQLHPTASQQLHPTAPSLGLHPHHGPSLDFESALVSRDDSPSSPRPRCYPEKTQRQPQRFLSLLGSRRGGPPARAKQSGDRKYRNTSDRFGKDPKDRFGSVWRLNISKFLMDFAIENWDVPIENCGFSH